MDWQELNEHLIPEPMSGCLLWLGKTTTHFGYGYVYWRGKSQIVHRIVWSVLKGPIPRGKLVLHKCDTPPCANINHLFLGTQLDNIHDMWAKGRNANTSETRHPWELNGRAKLTREQVLSLRAFRSEGESLLKLARRFSVSKRQVLRIIQGRAWHGLE